jgi:hypothetical protein
MPEMDILALPSEAEMQNLIDVYFSILGFGFPYLQEQAFRNTFREAGRNRFKSVELPWLILLNMVLALGKSVLVDGQTSKHLQSDESYFYYKRARGLRTQQTTRVTNLETGVPRYGKYPLSNLTF